MLRQLRAADRAPLEQILAATGAFSPEEVEVALELIDHGLSPDTQGYCFAIAERSGEVAGYACWGHTPLTEGVYDLYWIAVDPALHGSGVGRALLQAAETAVQRDGGRMLLIETASKPSYDKTREFYLGTGYTEFARVPDFYRLGDDKVIYGKRFDGASR